MNKRIQGGSARRIAGKLEKQKMIISYPLLLQLFLKYAYTVDVFIHEFTHMEFSDGTLPILRNFWKMILSMNLI